MVTPIAQGAHITGAGAPQPTYQPPFPRHEQDPSTQPPRPATAQEAQRADTEQAQQRAARAQQDQQNAQPRFTPENIDVTFRVIPQIHLAQARVIDETRDEVLREVPSTANIVFDLHFDQVLGRSLDIHA